MPSLRSRSGPSQWHEGCDGQHVRWRERVWPGAGVWLLAMLMVGSLVIALDAAASAGLAALIGAVVGGLTTWLLMVSSPIIHVDERVIRADRARLPWPYVGDVIALDEREFRAAIGPQAHARAFLVVRPWVRTGVKVTLRDPRDPHPYWIIGTHRPQRLRQAMESARPTPEDVVGTDRMTP